MLKLRGRSFKYFYTDSDEELADVNNDNNKLCYLCTLLHVPQKTMKVFPASSLSTDTR